MNDVQFKEGLFLNLDKLYFYSTKSMIFSKNIILKSSVPDVQTMMRKSIYPVYSKLVTDKVLNTAGVF